MTGVELIACSENDSDCRRFDTYEFANVTIYSFDIYCPVCHRSQHLFSLADKRDALRSKIFLPCPRCNPEVVLDYKKAGYVIGKQTLSGKCSFDDEAGSKVAAMELMCDVVKYLKTV